MMIYNSEFMQGAYQGNAGVLEKASAVAYQAVDDETHAVSDRLRRDVKRKEFQILSVSAMAPHKDAGTLIKALGILRRGHDVPATLVIAGSWPDGRYRSQIEALIKRLGLTDCVDIRGHVSREELNRLYAESRVFSLMSRCESFGIPAVEAQVFGMPVVSTNCCAIPEVCGAGGLYPEAGDAETTAQMLRDLLTDRESWRGLSEKARSNAARFRWDDCSRPLLQIFDVVCDGM
jgi:glycosyltransferase involved in cell wall biosynthesis